VAPLSPAARCTYGVQKRCREHSRIVFAQVNGYVPAVGAECCKTVGFAYPGSNPGPATTCGNAPPAADSRLRGAFLRCLMVCHLGAVQATVLRWARTHSGPRPVVRGPGRRTDPAIKIHGPGRWERYAGRRLRSGVRGWSLVVRGRRQQDGCWRYPGMDTRAAMACAGRPGLTLCPPGFPGWPGPQACVLAGGCHS